MDASIIKKQIQQMEKRYSNLKPVERYELALLITKNSSKNSALSRAITILEALQKEVDDRIVKALIDLHRDYYAIKKQYRSEKSKTTELNKKIERLKGLEQDLDKSNSPIREPLTPLPGKAPQRE
jgi:hypothetical protein